MSLKQNDECEEVAKEAREEVLEKKDWPLVLLIVIEIIIIIALIL